MVNRYIPSLVSPVLVGRSQELGILEPFLHKAEQGSGQVVLLAGEAGIGKSRLVAKMQASAVAKRFTVLAGYCFERDLTFPYAPLIDALHSFFTTQTDIAVKELLGGLGVELVKLLPDLALMLPELQPTPVLEPEAEKRRLFETLLRFLTKLPQPQQPLLLILEDLHWGDESSLDFLHLLARRIAGNPILVLATYRHEEVSPALKQLLVQLDHGHLAQQLMLQPLEYGELHAMLQAIFGLEQPIRSEFLDALYELTEGNPFFIEEVLKALTSAGDIFYAKGRWERKPLEELHIPASLQVAVQRRTLLLSNDARRLLTLAAVTGRRFDFALLQEIAGCDEDELLTLIKELIRAQLVIEESGERFAFRHALTRQAIYDDLLGRERQTLHRRIAEAIEHLYQAKLDSSTTSAEDAQVADLSYHYYHAHAWRKTLEYAQRAGARAQLLYAPRAAVEHFSRATEAVQHVEASVLHAAGAELVVQLYRARGLAYGTLGEFEEARADLEFALAQARVGKEPLAEWQLLLDLGYLWASRNYRQSGDYFQRALALARRLENGAVIAHSLNRVANWHANIEEPQEALAYHQEALAIFQSLDDQNGLAQTFDLLGMASVLGANLVQSEIYYRQAIAIFESLGDLPGLAFSLTSLSGSGYRYHVTELAVPVSGGADGWFHYAERGFQIAQEIGARSAEVYARGIISDGLWVQGRYGRALEGLRQTLALAQEIEHGQWSCSNHYGLGGLYLELLALPDARHHLEQSVQLAQEIGSFFHGRIATKLLVMVYLQEHEFAKAEALLDATFTSALPLQTLGQRSLWQARAEVALAQGDPGLALQITDQLIASAANIESCGSSAIPVLAFLRGKALDALQRWPEAELSLLDVEQGVQAQGTLPLQWRLHLLLGQVVRAQGRHAEAAHHFAAARQGIEAVTATLPASAFRDNFMSKAIALLPPDPDVRKAHSSTPLQTAKQSYGGLTRREREVALLIAQGSSNRAIAETLILGERTVEGYIANMLAKLNFSSRSQIAAWAVESGLTKAQKS